MRLKYLIWFLENKCDDAVSYLPEDYKKKAINRQWVANLFKLLFLLLIGNTLNEQEFQEMIQQALVIRETGILKKHRMEISTDPRIVKALQNTSMVSSKNSYHYKLASKGRSHLLLRDPDENKIPRKVKEKLDQKDQELDEAGMTILALKNEINELSNKIKKKE